MARWDNIGFLWEDIPSTRGARADIIRPRPSVPHTGWEPPRDFPNLSSAHMLSVDVETYDPELLSSGPGWARGRGHIVGVSVGAQDRKGNIGGWYFPMRHEDTPEDNMDPSVVTAWLRTQLGDMRPKFGANLLYDVGWLEHEGIPVKGMLYDIQHAEALLEERLSVSLDDCADRHLGEHKETSLLYQWCADYFGGKANDRQRANIYRAPPSLVGPYAEADATLPLRIMARQWPVLHERGLTELFDMECRLIPLLVAMRQAGVSIDIPFAEQLYDGMGAERLTMVDELKQIVGFEINVASGDDLKRAFDRHGLNYPTTAKGSASFTANFLETVEHPIGKKIIEIRQRDKLRNVFIKSYLLDNHVNGKVYCSFNQLRGTEGGTRSGRFSSSSPNLQNIPIRTEIGKKIRAAFVHDEGHVTWRKYDYSQIEYRLLAHYAVGAGADEMRQQYIEDPNTDYHVQTGKLITATTGLELQRSYVKNVNFGSIYGLGIEGMANNLNLTVAKAKEFMKQYHEGAPFVRATMNATRDEVNDKGFITTIMGRRTYFDMFEPDVRGRSSEAALPYDEARGKWGSNIRRAYTNPALNRRLQGSAADLLKKAMLKNWEDGVYDVCGVPRLTVHDELDHSDPGGVDHAFVEMRHNLETALPLRIPVIADFESGPNWGAVK